MADPVPQIPSQVFPQRRDPPAEWQTSHFVDFVNKSKCHPRSRELYFFITSEEFEKKKLAGEFAEWAEVHGNFYGTRKQTVDDLLAAGKHVLFAIDVQGALNLKKLYPTRALLIFIHPPSIKELQNRLIQRKGDTPEAIAKRLQNAYTEISWSQKFDYQITNDDLKKAYQQLKDIIQRECQ